MREEIEHEHESMKRRGFLECMAWVGTGLVWTAAGGILSSARVERAAAQGGGAAAGRFRFVQISDTHVGFKGEANPDAVGTLRQAVARIKALDPAPAFIVHTGDITHAQKPGAFDTVAEVLRETGVGRVFYVPGENDVFADGGKEYLGRFAAGGPGWQSFDYEGVHFVGLVNVLNFKAGRLGSLGPEQLAWLERDVAGLSSSTPIVVFAHVPLWAVYPKWGWVTEDGEQALSHLRRFGSVTVLNGHIHQTLQKVEGHVRFHTALSTAFPQPEPGIGPGPGPVKVPADELRRRLGLRDVTYVPGVEDLAVVDSTLA